MNYIYGPVPSRRLGLSLGVSPIPKKVCNYSCVYCQLGRTYDLTNKRKMFFPVESILQELKDALKKDTGFDVITIVGEGEPTLYAGLGELIAGIRELTEKPIAVITNGSLLNDEEVRQALYKADIVLPSLDAYDADSFKKINRPHGTLEFDDVVNGMKTFANEFEGQIWIEIMLMEGINDDDDSLRKYAELLKTIKHDRLYLNTPVRPPAESHIQMISHDKMMHAIDMLGGISIDLLASVGFHSDIADDYEAVFSIIRRHPMNQHEIEGFLSTRGCRDISEIIYRLRADSRIAVIDYKGYNTFRLK